MGPAKPVVPEANRSERPRDWRDLFNDEVVPASPLAAGNTGAGTDDWEPAVGDRGQVAYRQRSRGGDPMPDRSVRRGDAEPVYPFLRNRKATDADGVLHQLMPSIASTKDLFSDPALSKLSTKELHRLANSPSLSASKGFRLQSAAQSYVEGSDHLYRSGSGGAAAGLYALLGGDPGSEQARRLVNLATGLDGLSGGFGVPVLSNPKLGLSDVSNSTFATNAIGIRARVLSNIANSQSARPTVGFEKFLAKSDQIRWGYAADSWGMETLPAGSRVYGGIPGQSAYYTAEQSLLNSGLSREALFQSLQVNPHPMFGYRPQMGVYEVIPSISVPAGVVKANPSLGPGGATQYFIRDYSNQLRLIDTINLGQ